MCFGGCNGQRQVIWLSTTHSVSCSLCATSVVARNGRYKLHFATQIWTSVARPSPKCVECCPYGPTSLNGTGGSLCDCGAGDLNFHNPPLVYDMHVDRNELHPLGPDDIPNFSALVEETLTVRKEWKRRRQDEQLRKHGYLYFPALLPHWNMWNLSVPSSRPWLSIARLCCPHQSR